MKHFNLKYINLTSKHYRICGGLLFIISLVSFKYIWFSPGLLFVGFVLLFYKPDNNAKNHYKIECLNMKYLNNYVKTIIDNPIGTLNKDSGYIYPINTGYVYDEPSNSLIEAYIVGYYKPIEQINGKVMAILKNDENNKEKLVISLGDKFYSKDQIRIFLDFDKELYDYKIIQK